MSGWLISVTSLQRSALEDKVFVIMGSDAGGNGKGQGSGARGQMLVMSTEWEGMKEDGSLGWKFVDGLGVWVYCV